jgi:hypothetical protein
MTSLTDITRLATPTKDHVVGETETTPRTDRTVMVITTRPPPPPSPPPDDYHLARSQMQDAYRGQIHHRMYAEMMERRQMQDAYLSQIHHRMLTMNPGNQQEGHGSCIHQSICFPMKLYRVLAMASEFGFDHIISWKTDNRAFIIHDKVAFIHTILPQ